MPTKFSQFNNGGAIIPGDQLVGLRSGQNMRFNPFGSSGGSLTKEITQAAHGFIVGNILRLNGTQFVLARADNEVDSNVIGIVVSVIDVNTFVLQFGGYVVGLSGLVAGQPYYLSPSVLGAFTVTPPSNPSQFKKILFVADTTTSGYWLNNIGLGGASQAFYISPNGDDGTGDGTIQFPFATYSKASSIAKLLASATNQFVIIPLGIFNIAGNLTLFPFVNICGTDTHTSQFILTNQVLLDATFATTANSTVSVSNCAFTAPGNFNLTFTVYQNSVLTFNNVDFTTTSQFNVTGSGTNASGELVIVQNCVNPNNSAALTFINLNSLVCNSSAVHAINLVNTSGVTNSIGLLSNLSSLTGPVLLHTTAAGTLSGYINGCFPYLQSLTLDGATISLIIDSTSYIATPTFAGGAALANITLASLSDGSNANVNFTPANYTPTAGAKYKAESVTGNLHGIDLAIAAAVAGAALTKTDDTNVTATLTGTPATALLHAVNIAFGWAGQLSLTRGGTNASLVASNGGIFYSTATAGAILAGTATANQALLSGSSAAPAWSTATYPPTTTINQILYSSAANTITGLATANRAVLTTGATGIPVLTALASDGQLIIGSTAGVPAAATLTPGAGIAITVGSNSITIATTGAGFAWTDVTGATQALAVGNGYVTDRGAGVTYTLPATAALGDTIQIVGKLGLSTISQNANQQILISSSSSTIGVGGSIVATNVGDCITLVCITAGASTVWRSVALVGNWTVI